MLTKAMLSGLDEEHMALHPAGWYEAENIVQILNRQVTGILPQERTVILDGELKLSYTKLIYALGSALSPPSLAMKSRVWWPSAVLRTPGRSRLWAAL